MGYMDKQNKEGLSCKYVESNKLKSTSPSSRDVPATLVFNPPFNQL